MIDDGLRHTDNAVSTGTQTPTEIDLLLMCKEAGIKAAHLPIGLGADHQGRAGSPEDIGHRVVLPAVFLHGVEDAATAVGIAKAVKVTARSPGVLKVGAGVLGTQLGLAGCHLRMALHVVMQRLQPPLGCLHIGVEQKEVLIPLFP